MVVTLTAFLFPQVTERSQVQVLSECLGCFVADIVYLPENPHCIMLWGFFVCFEVIMRILMNDNAYEVSAQAAQGMLATVKRYVPKGIYAVEKDGLIEFRHDRCPTTDKVKELVEEFESRGFKVYANY